MIRIGVRTNTSLCHQSLPVDALCFENIALNKDRIKFKIHNKGSQEGKNH